MESVIEEEYTLSAEMVYTCSLCGSNTNGQWCYKILTFYGKLTLESYAYSCDVCHEKTEFG